jgi:hypothetical protein
VRLDDNDRERLFERLSQHAAAGRLDVADLPALPGDPLPASARRRRGHGHADAPEADWRPTNERFRDTRTNRVMRVWEDAGGQRHYVVDDEA